MMLCSDRLIALTRPNRSDDLPPMRRFEKAAGRFCDMLLKRKEGEGGCCVGEVDQASLVTADECDERVTDQAVA